MRHLLRSDGQFRPGTPAIVRFRARCTFDPLTGCVLWTGGKTMGRGHHVPYGAFWDGGRRWFAHRWAAKHIHGFDIDELQVDHCCPHIPLPNTLCVEHVKPIPGDRNRHLQTERRRHFVHLQVGLVPYEEVYGPFPEPDPYAVPFYEPPAWLGTGDRYGHVCPF